MRQWDHDKIKSGNLLSRVDCLGHLFVSLLPVAGTLDTVKDMRSGLRDGQEWRTDITSNISSALAACWLQPKSYENGQKHPGPRNPSGQRCFPRFYQSWLSWEGLFVARTCLSILPGRRTLITWTWWQLSTCKEAISHGTLDVSTPRSEWLTQGED